MADGAQPRDLRPREGAGATSRLLEELLAEGRPVAEIAVRLGISVPDAHARIARSTGTEAGLPAMEAGRPLPPRPAGNDPPGGAPASPGVKAAGIRPPARQPRAPERRRGLSRRAFLALTTAGVAGLATGAGFWVTHETGGPETVARPPRPIPRPPTLTPAPPPLSVLRPATGVFNQVSLDAGAPLEAEHGLFVMRTRGEGAGSVRGWQLAEPGGADLPAYRASTGGRFIATGSALHDRVSGQSWVWPEDQLRLLGFSDDAVLFERLDPEREAQPVKRGQYILTDQNLEMRAEFELTGVLLPAVPPIFEPGGRRAFLALDQPYDYPALILLDGSTSRTQTVLAPQQPAGLRRVLFQPPVPLHDGSSFLMPYSYWPVRPQGLGYGVFATFMAHFGWEGDRRGVTRVRVDRAFPSPDGSLMAGERVLPIPGTSPQTYEETSTVLVIDGKTGQNRFRIRSGRLNYGDELGGARWLADSSGLVVQTRIGGKLGYSIVSADGSRLDPLPDPPEPSGEWFEHPDRRGAVPSPDDPSLISFGRTHVYDRASGRWAGVDLQSGAPAHLEPWTRRTSDEVMLALPHQPHRVYPLLAEIEETRIEHRVPFAGDDA